MPAPVPLTLVVGDDEFLVSRAVASVVREAREADAATELAEFDGGDLEPGGLIEVLSPSLFGDSRVIVIRAGQDLDKAVGAEVLTYVGDPVVGISLVVVHPGAVKGKALLTSLLATGAKRLDAPKITKFSERREFVKRELKADGRQVSEEAVATLLDAVGNDLRELASAASQLLADTAGPITDMAVREYYKGRADASGFAIADKAVEGDLAGALELTRWGESTGLAPVLVTSALANALRTIGEVASAGREPAYVLAGQLGMPAWKVEKAQRQARGWRPDALSEAVRAVATADGQVKGEGARAQYAVERAVVAVVEARRSAS